MKQISARTTLGLALAAPLLAFAPLTQARECTLDHAAGRYGYTSNGTIVGAVPAPFTAVGHVTLGESGTFTGSQTTSIAGSLADETIQGTYVVNSDCTGSATVHVYHGTTLARTSVINLVWDNHENEFRAIFLTAGTSISILGRKMSDD